MEKFFELEQKIAQLEIIARRYQWIKENARDDGIFFILPMVDLWDYKEIGLNEEFTSLDEAIDSQLTDSKEKK